MIKHNLTFEQRRAIIPSLCKDKYCECDPEEQLECDRRLFVAERYPSSATKVDQAAVKLDAGKVRMDLLMMDMAPALESVAKVLTFAVETKGYTPGSWRKVKPFRRRYMAALYRHLTRRICGEKIDPESGLPHMAHAACCVLFMLSKEVE